MKSHQNRSKIQIAWISNDPLSDERLSNDQSKILNPKLEKLAQHFEIQFLKMKETSEQDLIQRFVNREIGLAFLPFNTYQNWQLIEKFLSLHFGSGPIIAGYFCEPMDGFKISMPSQRYRNIIFDFASLNADELIILTNCLLHSENRSGLKPLLNPKSFIYTENWHPAVGSGTQRGTSINSLLGLEEISKTSWKNRSSSIQILLEALLSLVYEKNLGSKKENPNAYFQVAADDHFLIFRLIYCPNPPLSAQETVQKFWPQISDQSQASQKLLKFSDFIRVHPFSSIPEVEIVVGLCQSAPAETSAQRIHTLWVEPLETRLLMEAPSEGVGVESPNLRLLPTPFAERFSLIWNPICSPFSVGGISIFRL